MALIASTALVPTRTVLGDTVMSSAIGRCSAAPPPLLSALLKSPSVNAPSSRLPSSTTSSRPSPLVLISASVSTSSADGAQRGSSAVFITSRTVRISRFPRRPAGWFIAYWSRVSALAWLTATAHVSPNTIWMAVEVTGAKSNGHSSRSKGRRTCSSHACGRVGAGTGGWGLGRGQSDGQQNKLDVNRQRGAEMRGANSGRLALEGGDAGAAGSRGCARVGPHLVQL